MANKFNSLPKKNVAGKNYVSSLTRLYAQFMLDDRTGLRQFTSESGSPVDIFEFQDVTVSDNFDWSNPTTTRKSITGGVVDRTQTGVEVSFTVNASRNFLDFLNNLGQIIGGVGYKNLNGELGELWIIKEEQKPVGLKADGSQDYKINKTAYVNVVVDGVSGGSEEGGSFATGTYRFKADERIDKYSGDVSTPYGSFKELLVGSGLPTKTDAEIKEV